MSETGSKRFDSLLGVQRWSPRCAIISFAIFPIKDLFFYIRYVKCSIVMYLASVMLVSGTNGALAAGSFTFFSLSLTVKLLPVIWLDFLLTM